MQTQRWRQIVSVVFCILLIGALSACSRGTDDATLTSKVKSKLVAQNPSLASAVNVETKDGVVTLSGAVDSDTTKSLAEQSAKTVAGVKSVVNNLTVEPQSSLTAPPATSANDLALKNAVETNLANYGVTGISATVDNGVVTLRGDIPRSKLQDAMKAANEAKPKRVVNQMNIK